MNDVCKDLMTGVCTTTPDDNHICLKHTGSANKLTIYMNGVVFFLTLRCVIPVVCVTNEREESVVNQHN